MQLGNLFTDPLGGFAHIERFVNDGSPSGFTDYSNMSSECRPTSGKASFELPAFLVPREIVTQRGTVPAIAGVGSLSDKALLPFHPDILSEYSHLDLFRREPDCFIRVTPTASGRTVMTDWSNGVYPCFIKLHYPRVIGRFRRDIPLFKWIASGESGQFFRQYLAKGSTEFGLFDECCGVYFEAQGSMPGFGAVFRSFPVEPVPPGSALLPAFGLFSSDRSDPGSSPLLEQILIQEKWSSEMFLNNFIGPLIQNYIASATTAGLIPECNAQNLVVQIFRDERTVRWHVRDMEDVWKDLTVRKQLGLESVCVRYHTIDYESDSDYYKRRSFMFDFKLGEYLLLPLARIAAKTFDVPLSGLLAEIRHMCREAWMLSGDYFEHSNEWYAYPDKFDVSRSFYEKRLNPLFR